MSRRWWIVFGAVLVGALAVVSVARFRTTTTPWTIDFDGVVGVAPGEPGIYDYVTEGHETVDAFGGGRHDYPGVTSMVITHSGCGPVVRWQPLEERWTEWEHCGQGLAVSVTSEYHEWFGIGDLEQESCASARPVFERADAIRCVAGPTAETYRNELIGRETLEVGGEGVEVIHVRRVSEVSGASRGTTSVDEWRVDGTPLVVRMEIVSSNVTASAIGDVAYSETVTLHLMNLLPRSG